MSFDYDLFVIGAGSGGVRAARMSASHGAKVAVAEEYRVGGTCVIRGCVPKKLFVYASHFAEEFEDAAGFGWTAADTKFDWPTLVKNKDAEIDRLNGIYIKNLEASGVEILQGRAIVKDANTVTLDGRDITAKYILVAVGGTPFMPQIEGIEHAISSNEAFHIEELPQGYHRRWRRLYCGGVCRHFQRAGRGHHAGLSRGRKFCAALTMKCATIWRLKWR